MSTNVLSYGAMALLLKPVSKSEIKELREQLHNKEDIYINYEGTIIYIDMYGESINPDIVFMTANINSHLIEMASKYEFEIDTSDIVKYVCSWYIGADPPMDTLTAIEFRAKQISS